MEAMNVPVCAAFLPYLRQRVLFCWRPLFLLVILDNVFNLLAASFAMRAFFAGLQRICNPERVFRVLNPPCFPLFCPLIFIKNY